MRGSVNAALMLERLGNDDPSGPRRALARLLSQHVFDTPLPDLLPQAFLATAGLGTLRAWTASPDAEAALRPLLIAAAAELDAMPQSLGDLSPQALRSALLQVASRTYLPQREVALAFIDRPAVRTLVRQLLVEAMRDAVTRLSAPVAGLAKGLSGFARLAVDQARAKSGTLGSIVGAVGGEVERQAEKRAAELADAALGVVMTGLVDTVCDSRHAATMNALRTAAVEGAFDLRGPVLAQELSRLDVPAGALAFREGLAAWALTDDAKARVDSAVAALHRVMGPGTLGTWAARAGIDPSARASLETWLDTQLRAVLKTPAMAEWLAALAAP